MGATHLQHPDPKSILRILCLAFLIVWGFRVRELIRYFSATANPTNLEVLVDLASEVSADAVVDITVDDRLDLLVLEEIRADEASWLDVSSDVDYVKTQ
eukprot:1972504-Amphidinium_carterae.1